VKNYSRCKGVVKRLPLIMQREERHEQAAYRNRWHREFIYWRKWAYLKYAVEHIKYALKHKKPLELPREDPSLSAKFAYVDKTPIVPSRSFWIRHTRLSERVMELELKWQNREVFGEEMLEKKKADLKELNKAREDLKSLNCPVVAELKRNQAPRDATDAYSLEELREKMTAK
jgi:hypothetical protein